MRRRFRRRGAEDAAGGPVREETTSLLNRWGEGSAAAGHRLMARIYPDLYRLAVHCQWGAELSARPSDLVQETFLRLARERRTVWNGRSHFFAVAARLIRRVVVDQVRFRGALKRSAADGWHEGPAVGGTGELDVEVLALHQALRRLALSSPSAARVVELRYFGGLSVDEIAELLDVGRSTVKRRWRFARAWLQVELGGEATP